MSLYHELAEAISETMRSAEETEEFERRFAKLIENYFDNSYQDNDISELIELVHSTGGQADGN